MSSLALAPETIRTAFKRRILSPGIKGLSNIWRIQGDPSLNDTEPIYVVRYHTHNGSYTCTCNPVMGSSKTKPCTHIAAVYLHERRRVALERVQAERRTKAKAEADSRREAAKAIPLRDDPRLQPGGAPPLPGWAATIRQLQWDAVREILNAFYNGHKIVMLQGPPGAGKTLIGELVRRLLRDPDQLVANGLYVCTTKSLQAQVIRDFPYATLLKGRANYPTLTGQVATGQVGGPSRWQSETPTAADCTSTSADEPCNWCDPTAQCPYRIARQEAQESRFTILNSAYALTEWNRGRGRFRGRDLAIMDEGDLLEDELLNQVEVSISKRLRERLGMAPPARKTVEASWPEWVQQSAIPAVSHRLTQLPPLGQGSVTETRERKRLEELTERLDILAEQLPQGGWVYDGYQAGNIVFRPVTVDGWGSKLLWPHAERFLLMSGTIISAEVLASTLGLKDDDYHLVDLPMVFPPENRPVLAAGVVEMRHRDQETAWPRMLRAVAGVLTSHPDDRVLIHTVSYHLANYIVRRLPEGVRAGRRIITYTEASQREAALAAYRGTPGSVLVASSMDRGIDLPGDLCRVQVICKVPFPSLGDNRTKARLYQTPDGPEWYAVNTIRTLVQMTGRGVRNEDDTCVTYVLDRQLTSNLWRHQRKLFPQWWQDAVHRSYPTRRLLDAAAPFFNHNDST